MARLALYFFLLAAGVLTTFLPPRGPIGEDSGELSPRRAAEHLALIAAASRPAGSAHNTRVREHIVSAVRALELEPEVQAVTRGGVPVKNVLARLSGRDGGPVILFAVHYDSRPETPGAGDDGAAVAAMLEVLRVLRSSPQLSRDVLFLFSDAEELGLLGAEAFVEEHPAASEVALVFNFDAIGNAGPPVLFETGPANAWAVAEFARACAHPVGSSLGKAVYDRMPNDTDFSPFRDRGLAGLNFALCCGSTVYHQPSDTLERLSRASLVHIGANALEIARHFGELELPGSTHGDAVFFTLLGYVFVHYSTAFSLPIALLAGLGCVALVGYRIRREGWRARELALAAGKLALVVAAAGLAVGYGVSALGALAHAIVELAGASREAGGNALSGTLAYLALACGTGWFLAASAGKTERGRRQVCAVALLVTCALCVPIASSAPGASHVLVLPTLGGLLSMLALESAVPDKKTRPWPALARTLGALPLLLLCIPSLHLVFMIASRARVEANLGLALVLAMLWTPLLVDIGSAGRTAPRGRMLALLVPILLLGLAGGVARAMGS